MQAASKRSVLGISRALGKQGVPSPNVQRLAFSLMVGKAAISDASTTCQAFLLSALHPLWSSRRSSRYLLVTLHRRFWQMRHVIHQQTERGARSSFRKSEGRCFLGWHRCSLISESTSPAGPQDSYQASNRQRHLPLSDEGDPDGVRDTAYIW